MSNPIVQTGFLLPQAVISNGATTGNGWLNPNNILLVDGDYAQASANQASDIIVGNFNFNLPLNAVVTGIEFKLLASYAGSIGSPLPTLQFYAVDDSSGTSLYYPYTSAFTGLTTSPADYSFGSSTYQFATSFTVDQINNLKLQLVANGNAIFVDCVSMNVLYYINNITPPSPIPPAGCIDCDSVIQAQPFYLALPVQPTDTGIYVYSFNYPDGTPINIFDAGSCGGWIDIVMDEGIPKGNGGSGYEENAKVINIVPQTDGTVFLDFGAVFNRGLQFHTPNAHDPALLSEHNVNAKVIISNSSPFYNLRFVRTCQKDIVFSPPIEVDYNGAPITTSLHRANFTGAGVTVTPDPFDTTHDVIINIPGNGNSTPTVFDTGSGTSGNVQVTSLTYTLNSGGTNRGVLVQISTEQLATVTGVTANGIPLTQEVVETDVGHNLRTEQWFLVAPPTGLLTIVVSLSQAAYICSGSETLVSVNQSSPIGANGTATATSVAPAVTTTTTFDNSIVFDSIGTGLTPILYIANGGQSEQWFHTANSDTREGAASSKPAGTAPDAVVNGYSITQNTPWVMTGLEIKGVSGIVSPQAAIQFEDETGSPLGSAGTVDELEVTGAGVTGTRVGNKVTYSVSAGASDHKVLVDGADTTADYLAAKIVAGTGVSLTILNPGGNEEIQINNTGVPVAGDSVYFKYASAYVTSGGSLLNTYLFTDTTEVIPTAIWAATIVGGGTAVFVRKYNNFGGGIMLDPTPVGFTFTPGVGFALLTGDSSLNVVIANGAIYVPMQNTGTNKLAFAVYNKTTGAFIGNTNDTITCNSGVTHVVIAIGAYGNTIYAADTAISGGFPGNPLQITEIAVSGTVLTVGSAFTGSVLSTGGNYDYRLLKLSASANILMYQQDFFTTGNNVSLNFYHLAGGAITNVASYANIPEPTQGINGTSTYKAAGIVPFNFKLGSAQSVYINTNSSVTEILVSAIPEAANI